MGQYFQIVAPKAQIALAGWGKLGEILFNASFSSELVHALAIPVRPQHVQDAASERNKRGADGTVLVHAPQSERGQTSRGGLISRKAEGAAAIAALHGQTITSFDDFPTETHRLIFAQLEDPVDVIRLGATSQYYWTIARECLELYIMSFMGQLAGKNIVCVGDYVAPNDYPPNLFTTEEQSALAVNFGAAAREGDSDAEDANGSDDTDYPFTLYNFTDPRVSTVIGSPTEPSSPLTKLMFKFSELYFLEASFPRTVRTQLTELTRGIDLYIPWNQQWILRNLTTKQFVRPEAVALKPEFIDGPFIRGWGFAEVVLSRICWSSDPSVSMVDTTNISRGVWAGHRFDIITHSRHVDLTKNGEGWEDVSDQIAAETAKILESEYGLDWRKEFYRDVARRRY